MDKKTKLKSLIASILTLSILMFFQNCDSGFIDNNLKLDPIDLSSGLDSGVVNYKPIINCSLIGKPGVYHNVSSITEENTFSSKNFDDNTTISVDCGDTIDESVMTQLTFAVDMNYDPASPNFIEQSGVTFTLPVLPQGNHNIALKITDPQGKASIKDFTLIVECENAPSPSLGDDASIAISITEGSKVGLFDFSVSGITGGTDFNYAWDFNGDNVFDPYVSGRKGTGSLDIWAKTASLSDIYVNMVTRDVNREIKLRVRNSCFKESIFTVTKDLTSTHPINATDDARILTYHYLQGDVSPNQDLATIGELSTKRTTGDYLATNNDSTNDYTEFRCQLKRSTSGIASLNIDTGKRYRKAEEALGGMSLQIANIADNGGDALQTFGYSSGQTISKALFLVAAASDGISQDRYSSTGSGCSIKMRLKRSTATAPCSDGSTKTSQVLQYYGEWSCPNLTSEADPLRSIKVENGKFFCEEALGDSCVGGGGGGGEPPPSF